MSSRNRIPLNIVGYGLYLYFLGLSFRNAAKALSFLKIIKISHVSIWKWLQKYRPWKYFKKRKIKEYVIDETVIKDGSELIWLWIVIEPIHKEILSFNIILLILFHSRLFTFLNDLSRLFDISISIPDLD